jgi:predicted pyridoxine 5'-phosphate oxidase superfamily flavin-nucleotide-binding protein
MTHMGHRFAELAFTDRVKSVQEQHGSREGYGKFEGGEVHHDRLGTAEAEFLAARDSLYMATVGATGWPYVQHRGGPKGFLKVLDERTIGFADFRGNRQYVSVGNLQDDDRVSLMLVDYPNRRRLKLLGRARTISADEGSMTLASLAVPGYRAKVEHGLLIEVEAFDWNCPQHITPRFTEAEVAAAVAPLHARIAELEAALAAR